MTEGTAAFRSLRIAAFLAYGTLLFVVAFLFMVDLVEAGFFVSLFVVPFCLGMFAQVVFDPGLRRGFWWVAGMCAGLSLLLLTVFLLIRVEALICIAVSLPILLPLEAAGIWLARRSLRNRAADTGTLRVSLVVLPLLVLPLDMSLTYPMRQAVIRSQVVIDAPPQTVWRHTVEIPPIQPQERVFTFSHMILRTPRPISAVLLDGVRDLRWTRGVRFREVITDRVENARLAWRFDFFDPASLAAFDRHVSPNSTWLQVERGFYALEPTADGRTRLTLETHYGLATPYNAYLLWWGRLFLGDFHKAVLAVIKTRAEADRFTEAKT